jgi:hypothetical protein
MPGMLGGVFMARGICDAISANHKLEAIDLDQKSQF